MTLNLGCIVEGRAEVEAVPLLLRRIQQEIDPGFYLETSKPIRVARNKLVKADVLENAVELAARQLRSPRAILILIDADDDCPAQLGPKLLARAQAAHSDVPIAVVLAKREYEAWFLAAIESLQGHHRAESAGTIADPTPSTSAGVKSNASSPIQSSRTPKTARNLHDISPPAG